MDSFNTSTCALEQISRYSSRLWIVTFYGCEAQTLSSVLESPLFGNCCPNRIMMFHQNNCQNSDYFDYHCENGNWNHTGSRYGCNKQYPERKGRTEFVDFVNRYMWHEVLRIGRRRARRLIKVSLGVIPWLWRCRWGATRLPACARVGWLIAEKINQVEKGISKVKLTNLNMQQPILSVLEMEKKAELALQ